MPLSIFGVAAGVGASEGFAILLCFEKRLCYYYKVV